MGTILALATTLGTILWFEHQDKSDYALREAIHKLGLVADLTAAELQRSIGDEPMTADHLEAVARVLPETCLAQDRRIYLGDRNGDIIAAEPSRRGPRSLSDLLGEEAVVLDAAESRQAVNVTLQDRAAAIVAVRTIPGGHVAVVQPLGAVMEVAPTFGRAGTVTLALAILGLTGLGAVCQLSAQRARESETDCSTLRRRLETSLTRGRCGMWDWDIGRGEIFWSTSMYELLGYEPRDTKLSVGEINCLLHPDDANMFALSEHIMRTGRLHIDHKLRARSASGEWVWLRARAEVLTEPVDGSRHLVGIAMDVTDERRLAEQSAAADERLRDAVEAISEAFVLWDADDRLVLCNSRFRQLHDLPPEKVRPGADYAQFVEAASSSQLNAVDAIGAPSPAVARTREVPLRDGRWLQVNERRTHDGGFVSVGTDITELKRQQAKLVASEKRLIRLVAEMKRSRQDARIQAQRFADLAERYHEQRDEAESASRAKTEFLAKMSHELRTPLNAIIGFADVMSQEYLGPLGSPRYAEYVRDIQASGYSLLEVIDGILRMSKIDTGDLTLSPCEVAIAPIVGRALASVEKDASARNLALVSDAVGPWTLWADPGALEQILTQLLHNSVKFTPSGGTVTLRVRPAGEVLNMFVSDDGIGIPADFLPRLGKPFEQVETEYQRRERGCGLGLPLAKALTELHDGALRVRSQEGVGTVVLVRLPMSSRRSRPRPPTPPARSIRYLDAAE